MGAVTDIFTPDVPKQPAIFTANDGSVWPTQGDADNRNNEVQRNADRQQARNQGYTGDFGQGGYKRFSENYSQDQNNPGGPGGWLRRAVRRRGLFGVPQSEGFGRA